MKRTNESHASSSLLQAEKSSRRQFLARGGRVMAGSALAGILLSRAYAGEDSTIRLALVGCGGRGSGAVGNALSSQTGPTKLIAMADVFDDRLTKSHKAQCRGRC
jgi:hypothetical protein